MNTFKNSLVLLVAVCLFGCESAAPAQTWYRGNTHTHTVICGHADSTPEHVAAWYHDRGYHFLVLSEHNHFIDPATVELPEPTRDDFILIPGVEITGARTIHTTAMNVDGVPPWRFTHADKSKIIQNHADETIKLGGHAILNHPNFHYAVTADHMTPVRRLVMFELFNGHPAVHNHGDHEHPSTEAMWDQMLTGGKRIYGVSSDDAHHFQTIAPNKSNPGRGWVMVSAKELTADAITEAMAHGDFYASNGVFLTSCGVLDDADTYTVVVDADRTRQELHNNPKLRGERIEDGEEGFRIQFIGPQGKVLAEIDGTTGAFRFDKTIAYVRPKVTYIRKHPDGNGYEAYYAWGQPVFTDERAKQPMPE
jgi:hypothetical protein